MEPSNSELYDIIRRLSEKIETLEKQIATPSQYNSPTPSIGFDKWLDSCIIGKQHVEIVYTTGDVMEAFKQCCLTNRETMPVFKCGNKFLVWDDGKWTAWNDENTRLLIQEMWRKMVYYDVIEQPDKTVCGATRDARTAQITNMRHKLYDVKKNRGIVLRWLKDQF
jgi:hypothetical protein